MGPVASFWKQSYFIPEPTFTEKNLGSQAGKACMRHLTCLHRKELFELGPTSPPDHRELTLRNRRSSSSPAQTQGSATSSPPSSIPPTPPSTSQRALNLKPPPPSTPSSPRIQTQKGPSTSSSLTSRTSPPSRPPPRTSSAEQTGSMFSGITPASWSLAQTARARTAMSCST
jgi:hypothetical protein